MALVEQGVSQAPIVVFQDAPPFTRNAAEELAEYIEKTSGARPELIEGRPDPIPEHAIWVGYQPVLRDVFPGVDFEFKHPEEILIACDGKNLVIAGRDVWDPEHMVVPDKRGKDIVGKQQEYGTINAVYTFLQDCLGVRWLWPGELGEDVLQIPTIELPAFVYRYHPSIRARAGMMGFSALGNRGYGQSQDWMRLQRLQLGSLQIGGGHAFGGWWERFHETNPEYFALQPDGTRGGGEKPYPSAHTVKMCHSNPDLARKWVDLVDEQLERDPNLTVFNASPNDGWASGHCVCDNCRAWDHPDNELRGFSWKGFSTKYVALTDREVTFANVCAKLLKERYPDKDYYVLMMSYGHSRPAPIEARPADNVIISSVANFLGRGDMVDRGSSLGTTYREQYAAWSEIAPNLVWRPNTGSPAGWQQGQPDVAINKAIQDLKLVGENNCIGIFIDSVWEHWATQGPQYYVMAQLVWDPSKDGHAIMEDYYQRAFGKGAEALKAYWKLLEDKREVARLKSIGRGWDLCAPVWITPT
ncbi:MAG: DUF4838 domain-containing protein [Lentisphaerae bacterium]|nr:DUF4838 domain-containing protein [Lentisphaerota bacterium]